MESSLQGQFATYSEVYLCWNLGTSKLNHLYTIQEI